MDKTMASIKIRSFEPQDAATWPEVTTLIVDTGYP
jgi:hypothetical protein